MDSYTEDSSSSLGGRLMESLKGIVIGLVMVGVALGLLFWNEGRAVRADERLSQGAGAVVSVAAARVDAANEGRLIHLSGPADSRERLADPVLGVSAQALRLARVAETYQWQETSQTTTQKKLGGGEEKHTTYTYEERWAERLTDSSNFKLPQGHANPAQARFESQEWSARQATLGAFALPDSLVAQLTAYVDRPVTQAELAALPADIRRGAVVQDGRLAFSANPAAPPDPANPKVGDTRVSFRVVEPGPVSVVARQNGKSLEAFPTLGGPLELIEAGTVSADLMFKNAESQAATLTWILRLVGLGLCCVGIFLVLRPLAVVSDVIPFLGSLVGAGLAFSAFLLGLALSLVAIALSWLGHRPLLAGSLLLAAAALVVLSRRGSKPQAAQGG